MFKKVLVVEDQEIANLGITRSLQELSVPHFDFAAYCDEAFHKIVQAVKEGAPYDLVVSDLSFEKDHISQSLHSGQELIREARKVQPDLKIVVLSVEKKARTIEDLYKVYGIQAFVSKSRNDGRELRSTLRRVFEGETVMSQAILNAIRNSPCDLNAYDLKLLELLSQGHRQKEIENLMKQFAMKPYGRRSIEKRLNELRDILGAKNNIEMIVICKDTGLI
ncbi:response regulator [uncultured Chryseobacterium sp.]|uniref:response regulator n=1 Tax=uncultured Chryseobacterium sp. TaxID=259322 RepID=UPI0025D09158|nr:response regulator [uncultured Chryseobacterium sp.]